MVSHRIANPSNRNVVWVRLPVAPPVSYIKGIKGEKFYGNFKAVCSMADLLQGAV